MRFKKLSAVFLAAVLPLSLFGVFASESAETGNVLSYANFSDTQTEDAVNLDITVSNAEKADKELQMIQAVYDKNGKLLDVDFSKEKISEKETAKTFSFNLLENDTAAQRNETSLVKYFAWESVSGELTMRPAEEHTETSFENSTEVSRLTACMKLAELLELYPTAYQNIFTDVASGKWYAGYLQTLSAKGILSEEKTSFGADESICQKEFAELCQKAYAAATNGNSETAETLGAELFDSYSADGTIPHGDFMKALARLKTKLATAGFVPKNTFSSEAPIIYKTEDEIAPGDSVQIYGENLYYIKEVTLTSTTNSNETYSLQPIQTDTEGHFLTAVLPKTASGGVYGVSVTNGYGKSKTLLLNQPRPFWVAESDVLMEGMTAKLVGSNLSPARFGATGETQVKLRVNNEDYAATVTKEEPYKLEFTVPATETEGKCTILLSADGINWTELDDEQSLTVKKSVSDPYELGVGWAGDYNYTNRIDVTDSAYGVKGDGTTDDREAFAKAMKALKEKGGGVLYIPKGDYLLSYLTLYDGVILEGENQTETRLLVKQAQNGTRPNSKFIYNDPTEGQNGTQGITNLTIAAQNPDMFGREDYRDMLIHLYGHESSTGKADDYKNFFMKDVTVDLPIAAVINKEDDGKVIGYRMLWRADVGKNVLMKNCNTKGARAGFVPITADYATVTDCKLEAVASSLESVGCYALFENNTVKLHPEYRDEVSDKEYAFYAQGIFARSHFYVAKNKFENLGTDGITENDISNDGEIVCSENPNLGTVKMAGTVVSATATTATLSPLTYEVKKKGEGGTTTTIDSERLQTYGTIGIEENDLTTKWGEYYLQIVGGRGLGQYRRVTALNNRTVTLDKAWDIVPDSSSEFLLMTMTLQGVIYNNNTTNAQKGYWLYGGTQDCIIADNVGTNVGGILTVGFDCYSTVTDEESGITTSTYRRMPSYFTLVKNNSFTGYAKGRNHCCIAIESAAETQDPVGYLTYGAVVKGNRMSGANQEPQSWDTNTQGTDPYASEAPNRNGIVIGNTNPRGEPKHSVTKAVTIENNVLSDMTNGISVMGESTNGVLLRGNEMEQVQAAYTKLETVRNLKDMK